MWRARPAPGICDRTWHITNTVQRPDLYPDSNISLPTPTVRGMRPENTPLP